MYEKKKKNIEKSSPAQWIGVPYISGVSEAIKRVLRPLGLELCHRPEKWQWSLCNRLKDKTPTNKKKGVVYEIPCGDCELTYVGETPRTVTNRVKEHRRAVVKGDIQASAIASHVWQEEHKINVDKTRVIDRATGMTERRVKEALHIQMRKGEVINVDAGLTLSEQWKGVIK